MARPLATLEHEIRALGNTEKEARLRVLREELDGPPNTEAESAWLVELQRRSSEIKSGAVEPVPAEEVFARLGMPLLFLLLFILTNPAVYASDLEDLARDGYGVVEETSVDGDFEGCDFDKHIPLSNGLVFVCSEYSYTYSYSPEVLILEHVRSGDIKVLIDDEEYEGTLYRRR